MELLVVTLASTKPGKDAEVLARIRLISNTIHNALGLVTSRFYRSRGGDSYYLILTTWHDEESWHKAQERHNPRQLLSTLATELLTAPPEQWLMHYLWGYSRPATTPILATAQISTIRPDHIEFAQQGWIKGLQLQASQSTLAFAFLARGIHEENTPPPAKTPTTQGNSGQADVSPLQGPVLLNLLSWGSESDQEEFFADPNYQAINRLSSIAGTVKTFPLEPM